MRCDLAYIWTKMEDDEAARDMLAAALYSEFSEDVAFSGWRTLGFTPAEEREIAAWFKDRLAGLGKAAERPKYEADALPFLRRVFESAEAEAREYNGAEAEAREDE